jgi:methanogenic corrinoid protein MtbC1
MDNMGRVIRALTAAGLRQSFPVMIGGGPTTPDFAREIGADGHGRNAKEAIDVADELSRRLP